MASKTQPLIDAIVEQFDESDDRRAQRFLDDLEAAERKARDDAGRWLDYWPIVSFGVHIGFGGGR